MSTATRLLHLHGAIVDLIYYVEAIPAPGTEAVVNRFNIAAGGGFNAMAAATRMGLAVSYAGKVGSGPLGDLVANALAAEKIEALHPRDERLDQGCCTVMIDPSGERTFVAAEGAEGHVSDQDLQRINLSAYDWSLLSGYTLFYEGSVAAFTHWLSSTTNIPNLVFDPSPIIGSVNAEATNLALATATWVSANTSEAEFLTGESDPVSAARQLARGRSGGAVVRNAAEGCVVAWNGQTMSIPGCIVETVDTNGAGDTHVGAFIAALAYGRSPQQAARYANIAAALSTTCYGPASAPDHEAVEATLRLRQAH